jgi:hypothetical protein
VVLLEREQRKDSVRVDTDFKSSPYETLMLIEQYQRTTRGTGVPSVVVGIGVGMEGGAAGVQLLVEDDRVELALKVLGDA